ncbi:MAG: glycosyltransferase family 2 protein [Gemmatimonadaceae bacterium]
MTGIVRASASTPTALRRRPSTPVTPTGDAGEGHLISIIVPSHNEGENIRNLRDAIQGALADENLDFELLVVDDSTDDTWRVIEQLAKEDVRVSGVRLARRFGQQAALVAGFRFARGAAVVTMDADLQHPPTLIPELVRRWREGIPVVHTQRLDTEVTGGVQRVTSRWFYRMFSALSGVPMNAGAGEFRLLDRRVVDYIVRMTEGEVFIRGVVSWLGFPSVTVPFRAAPRQGGRSAYSFKRRFRMAATAIISFSILPLRVGMVIGFATAALSFGYLLYALIVRLQGGVPPGWASIVSFMAFLFGVQFVLIGLVGEYIGRIHLATKQRPPFVVDYTTGMAEEARTTGVGAVDPG